VRVRIPIENDADVAVAGEHGRRLASRLDFSPTDVTVIATAILEVARNVLRYARRGDLMLHLIQKRGRLGSRSWRGTRVRGSPMSGKRCETGRALASRPCGG